MEVAELGHRAMVQVRSTSAARGRPLDASRATVPRAREGSIVSRSFLRSAIGRSGTGACRVTAFAIELFDCQFQKRFRQATDS